MHIRHICKYYMTLFISLSLAVLLYIRNIPFAWVVEKGFTHKTFSVWIEGEPGVSGGKKSDVCTCIFCTWNSFGMLKCVCVRERDLHLYTHKAMSRKSGWKARGRETAEKRDDIHRYSGTHHTVSSNAIVGMVDNMKPMRSIHWFNVYCVYGVNTNREWQPVSLPTIRNNTFDVWIQNIYTTYRFARVRVVHNISSSHAIFYEFVFVTWLYSCSPLNQIMRIGEWVSVCMCHICVNKTVAVVSICVLQLLIRFSTLLKCDSPILVSWEISCDFCRVLVIETTDGQNRSMEISLPNVVWLSK